MPPPATPSYSLWPPGHPRHPDSIAASGGYDYSHGGGEDDHDGNNNLAKMRSVQFAAAADDDDRDRPRSEMRSRSIGSGSMGRGGGGAVETAAAAYDIKGGDTEDDDSDSDTSESYLLESEPEPTTLPESTHTLFFTHDVCSVPFAYAAVIVVVSVACLGMALADNVQEPEDGNLLNVPHNVTIPTRCAQYLAIFTALLMEEGKFGRVFFRREEEEVVADGRMGKRSQMSKWSWFCAAVAVDCFV